MVLAAVAALAAGGTPVSAVESAQRTGQSTVSSHPATPDMGTVVDPVALQDAVGISDPAPDDPTAAVDPTTATATSTSTSTPTAATLPPTEAPAAACTGTQDRPQLEPEALGTLTVRSDDPSVPTAAGLGYDGEGVKIGIVSTPMDPSAPDFLRRDGTSAVVDFRRYTSAGPDDGTAALEGFGDVSSIVAQGNVAHDLATVVNSAAVSLPGGHCWVRIVGVAPAADVIVANAMDAGTLSVLGAVQAIEDAVAEGVDVLSLSFGVGQVPDTSQRNALVAATTAAVEAGVTVVVSSGDAGPNSTVSSPAADPRVISVGATVNGRLPAQVGQFGLTRFGDGSWPSATAASLSSSGFTHAGGTIDVVAPGDRGWSVCVSAPRYPTCAAVGRPGVTADIAAFYGTSQSAPLVAGVAALVIQAYRDTHGGQRPTPDQVQRLLTGTAADLGLPADVQGSGLVDARSAVLAARGLDAPGARTDVTDVPTRALVADSAQVSVNGTGAQHVDVRVTNTGSGPVRLDGLVVTRDEPAGRQTLPVEFDPDGPTFADGDSGMPMTAVRRPFRVEPGAAQLNVQVAGNPVDPRQSAFGVRVLVLDPTGRPAAFAEGQNGLQVQVPSPSAGDWTAVIQTVAGATFRGELAIERTERRVIADGRSDVPSVPAGGSTTVRAVVPMPTEPGDAAATFRIADQLALPVIQRVPVDLAAGPVDVSTVVRPQNGRPDAPAQQATWEFDVPAGKRTLDVVATLGEPADALMTAVLIGPDGLPRSIVNNLQDPAAPSTGPSTSQAVTLPEPGRWRFVLSLYSTGWTLPATRAAATVSFALDRRVASASGLPEGEEMAVGSSRTVTLSLQNPGSTTVSVAVDPRTDGRSEIQLPMLQGPSIALPLTSATVLKLPYFMVPLFSTRLSLTARSTVPTFVGFRAPLGASLTRLGLGVEGGPAAPSSGPSVVIDDAGRAPGPWSVMVGTPGPVVGPVPSGRAEISARVETASYDPTVTDAAGRPFVTASGPASDVPLATLQPGDTMTARVTLPTRGAPGDRISGFLALTAPAVDGQTSFGSARGIRSGDVLAVFPYSYTVVAAEPTTTPPPTSDPSTTPPSSPESTTSSPTTDTSTTPSSTTATSTAPAVSTAIVTAPPASTPPARTSTVDVVVPPVAVDPFVPAWTPTTYAVAAPVALTTPVRVAAAPTGTLPSTGLNLLPWLMSALAAVVAGAALIAGTRSARRPRKH